MNTTDAAAFAATCYGLRPAAIEILPPLFAWRGIYRIQETSGELWLLRLLQHNDAAAALEPIGALLEWLAQHRYPAPQLRRTSNGALVAAHAGWHGLLVSYLAGTVFDRHAPDVDQIGRVLGQLHELPLPSQPTPHSDAHPAATGQLLTQLAAPPADLPERYLPMLDGMRAALRRLRTATLETTLTHGDCWYRNVIRTPSGRVALIDWDCAGAGAPLLDLGYLILTAHYDLSQPLCVTPDPITIANILRGYQEVRPIYPPDPDLLVSATRFPLARHTAAYLANSADLRDNDPVLEKIAARYVATEAIAQIAASHRC